VNLQEKFDDLSNIVMDIIL